MNFKHHINEHFRSCHKLADAHDPHRNREVCLFLIPGEQRYVGVSDGVDAFVAPTDIQPYGVDCRKLIGDYLAMCTTPAPRPRVRITETGRHVDGSAQLTHPALEHQQTLIKKERIRVRR